MYEESIRTRSFEHSLLWWLAAGVCITMIWMPIVNAVMCIGFLLFSAYYCRFRFKAPDVLLFLLFISCYLFAAASFFYSYNRSEALRILQLKLPLLLFPLGFSSGIKWSKAEIAKLLRLFSLSVGLFCLFTIINAVFLAADSGNTDALFGYRIIPFSYVYASVVSLFCVFGVIVEMSTWAIHKKVRSEQLILIALFCTTLILLSNRMGVFLCLIITLFFLVRMVRSAWVKLVIVLSIIISSVGLYSWNQTLREKVQAIVHFNKATMIPLDRDASLGRTWDGFQLRLAIWNCAAGVINKNFWSGVGVGDGQATLQTAYEERKFYFASRHNTYNAHNQFLEQWLLTGIAGFFLFTVSLVVSLVYSFRSGSFLYTLFLIIFICFCVTESLLEVSKGVVWFSFFNAMFAFAQQRE